MGVTTQTFMPPESGNSKNVLVTNLNILSPNTEQAHGLQISLKQLLVRNRNHVTTKISFVSGGPFLTVPPGTTFSLGDIDLTGKSIYLQASAISTVEIVETY